MTPPRHVRSKKHSFLTIEKKLEILELMAKGEKGTSLASRYGVGKSTIYDLKKNRSNLLEYASTLTSQDAFKNRKTTRRGNNSFLDHAMNVWFAQMRRSGKLLSTSLMCEKALEFNKKLGGPEDFKASSGWLQRFKDRSGIKLLECHQEIDFNTLMCQNDEIMTDEDIISVVLSASLGDDVCLDNNEELAGAVLSASLGDDGCVDNKEELAGVVLSASLGDDGCVENKEELAGVVLSASLGDDGSSDNNEELAGPSHSEAFHAVEMAISWIKKQPECTESQLACLQRIRDLVVLKIM